MLWYGSLLLALSNRHLDSRKQIEVPLSTSKKKGVCYDVRMDAWSRTAQY
jgi:hypothetical protein